MPQLLLTHRNTGLTEAIFRSSTAFARFDADGFLRSFTHGFETLFAAGSDAKIEPGAHCRSILPERLSDALLGAVAFRAPGAEDETLEECEEGIVCRTCQGRWVSAEANRLADGDTLCVFHDITAFKKAERRLRRGLDEARARLIEAEAARKQAELSARARSELLANVSHELRTPLNAILGFSEMVKSEMFGPLGNPRYREYGEIIHTSGSHLLELINDVLDMSKLEAGKLELQLAPVEICKLVVESVRGVEPQARGAQVGVRAVIHEGIGAIRGDRRRLRQMLLNLLSNAIKFTREGGEVCVSAFRKGASVGIAVSDTGIGIREEDIPKVLEPFGQIDSEQARRHAGTGLGLPLTKELAERHGGTLTIESTVGVGTTATILLPGGAPEPVAA